MEGKIPKEKKQVKYICFIAFSFFIFSIFLLLNFNMSHLLDDYIYRFVFKNIYNYDNAVKVSSLSDIYRGMKTHYMIWGGRIPVHAMLQLLLLFNKSIFNFCNAMITVLLGLLVYFHANYGKKRSFSLFLVIFTMIWFFIPAAGYNMIYMTGAINYLWVCVYVLLFLIPFRVYMENQKDFNHSAVLSVVIIPFGFLAGWSNEPSGGVSGLFILMLMIYLIIISNKPPIWMFTGIASVAGGLAVLVLAPGYKVKAEQLHGAGNLVNYTIKNFGQQSKEVFQQSFDSLWPLFIIFATALILLFKLKNKRREMIRNQKGKMKGLILSNSKPTTIFFFVCAAAAISIYTVSPEFEPRYLFTASVFLIISIGNILSRIFEIISEYMNLKEKTIILASITLISACFVLIAVNAIAEYHISSYNNSVKISIENNIKSQIESGKKDVVLKGEYRFINGGQFNVYKKGVFDLYVLFGGQDSDDLINSLLAATFGAEKYVNEATLSFINSE